MDELAVAVPALPSLEYIAGFFDGEGCIRNQERNGRPDSEWHFLIINTHLDALRKVQKVIGGLIRPRKSGLGKKPIWMLQICGRLRVLAVMLLLYPYLIVKKEHVANLIRTAQSFTRKQRTPVFCYVAGCNTKQIAKHLCNKHYIQRRKELANECRAA